MLHDVHCKQTTWLCERMHTPVSVQFSRASSSSCLTVQIWSCMLCPMHDYCNHAWLLKHCITVATYIHPSRQCQRKKLRCSLLKHREGGAKSTVFDGQTYDRGVLLHITWLGIASLTCMILRTFALLASISLRILLRLSLLFLETSTMACLSAIAWILSSLAQAVASKAACSKCAMSANLEPVSHAWKMEGNKPSWCMHVTWMQHAWDMNAACVQHEWSFILKTFKTWMQKNQGHSKIKKGLNPYMAFPCMNRAADLLKKDVAQTMPNIFWGHNPPFDSCHVAHLRGTYDHQDAMHTVHHSSFCHGKLPRSPPCTLAKQTLLGTGKWHHHAWIVHPTCLTQCFQHQNDPKGSQRNKLANIWKIMCPKKKVLDFLVIIILCSFAFFAYQILDWAPFSVPKEGLGMIILVNYFPRSYRQPRNYDACRGLHHTSIFERGMGLWMRKEHWCIDGTVVWGNCEVDS